MTLKSLDLRQAVENIKKRGPKTTPESEDCKRLIEIADALVHDEQRLLSIKEASMLMGVSQQTLRNWHTEGKFVPAGETPKGHRRYTEAQVNEFKRLEMKDCEIILPDLKPSDLLDMVQHSLSNFDPDQRVSVIVTSSTVRRKVFITVDSEDGLTSITKTFRMED